MAQQPLDLATVRSRLAGQTGPRYWRSLEELAETEEFQEFLQREFPRQASGWLGPVSRRSFLKVMAASLALAGMSGCAPQPAEKIVPYVQQPEELIPGKPLFFATAMPLGGYATGLLVENHMGRPTKVEGNPRHPASLGATDAFAQASILSLYDPERSQAVLRLGQINTWDSFVREIAAQRAAFGENGGAGLRILTETVTSPTFAAQIGALLDELPAARWHQWEPCGLDNVREGARLALGRYVNTTYRFDRAARVLSLDSDFMMFLPGNLRYSKEFIDRRRVEAGQTEMNRLYVVESTPTITGSMADHRIPVRASQIEGIARAIAGQLGVDLGGGGAPDAPIPELAAIARDLEAGRGTSIVIAGEEQPAIVHAIAHAINDALGNIGETVVYTDPVEANPVNQLEDLRTLVQDMDAGQVTTLVIVGGNPVYTAPADFRFAERLDRVPLRVHLNQYVDETSDLCHWHIPESHYLEAWSDIRAFDGTVTIMQPLIQPLYNTRTAHELLGALLGRTGESDYETVRAFWQTRAPAGDFDTWWRTALHDGVVPDTAAAPVQASVVGGFAAQGAPAQEAAEGLELIFRPDPSIYDGRFANNGWLQELPKPLTTLTWDNAAYVSPATAERLGLHTEDVVEMQFRGRVLPAAAIWVMPGHPDDAVTLTLGYGRSRAGSVGDGYGFNAYGLRGSDAMGFGGGLQVQPTGGTYRLANVQQHFSVEGRSLVRVGTLEEYLEHPEFVQEMEHAMNAAEEQEAETEGDEPEHPVDQPPSLLPEYPYEGYRWGMTINLQACIGCNACVVACQAENNIPIVGKENVLRSREMHWLKVDRYYEGSPANPKVVNQPRPCMHCEKAPCEPVCPVEATSHSSEGLNEMTYNRCVGTKYCSNNCPYKVRRFNYLDYQREEIPVIQLRQNPDVTVRARGVMEKCTYCVQRINNGRIEAERAGRRIQDGEVRTACQEVCPTQAIIFGDINDPDSQVARLKQTPLNYGMLAEIGTQPRTSYLARLSNPNPELATEEGNGTAH